MVAAWAQAPPGAVAGAGPRSAEAEAGAPAWVGQVVRVWVAERDEKFALSRDGPVLLLVLVVTYAAAVTMGCVSSPPPLCPLLLFSFLFSPLMCSLFLSFSLFSSFLLSSPLFFSPPLPFSPLLLISSFFQDFTSPGQGGSLTLSRAAPDGPVVGAGRFGGGGLGGGGVNPDQDAVRGGLGSGGAASSGVQAAPAALSVHRSTATAAPARAAVGGRSDGGGAGSSTGRGGGGMASLGGAGGAGLFGRGREGAGRVGGRGVGGEVGGFGEHTPGGRAYDSESQRNPSGSDTTSLRATWTYRFNNLMVDECRGCGTAFDFNPDVECCVITCVCGFTMCAWCMDNCDDDPYRHVSLCRFNPQRGSVTTDSQRYQRSRSKRKQATLIAMLRGVDSAEAAMAVQFNDAMLVEHGFLDVVRLFAVDGRTADDRTGVGEVAIADVGVGTGVAQGGGANDVEGRNGPSDFDKICVICIESCADGCYDTHPGCTARNAFAHPSCFARVLINSYSKWCFDSPCCWLTKKNII